MKTREEKQLFVRFGFLILGIIMWAGLDQLVWLIQFTGVSFSLVLCEVLGELPLSPAKFRWQGRQKSLATTRTENAASDFNFVNPIVLYPVFKLPYSYLLVEPLNPGCQDPDIAIRGFFFSLQSGTWFFDAFNHHAGSQQTNQLSLANGVRSSLGKWTPLLC